MNIDDFKRGAVNYAYQLRKNYPDTESPITQYICDKEIVVISTKKLYIFYIEKYVDYIGDKLSKVIIRNVDLERMTCTVFVSDKKFDLKFSTKRDLEMLIKYIEKYK